MKVSLFRTIRWKFIFIFMLSALLTYLFLLFLYRFFEKLLYTRTILSLQKSEFGDGSLLEQMLQSESPLPGFFHRFIEPARWIINNIGSTTMVITVGSSLFLLLFFLFTKRIIRYLEEITTGIQAVAKGDFSHEIRVRSADELGIVASNVNVMATQLEKSIEEERHAEKTKNDLITGVSHDLRTPLTSILGFLELVDQDRYKDEVELRYYVGIAYDKALSLKRLVHDLFEYTRIQSKDLPLQWEQVNVVDFLRQLIEEFVPSFQKKKLTFVVKVSDQNLLIRADGNELVRAYENLIANAIQYSDENSIISFDIRREQDQVVVAISNKGNTIPERDLPYVFERFFRSDLSRTEPSSGSGLGLAITKSIIELHQGHITAQSQARQTTFTTYMPVHSK